MLSKTTQTENIMFTWRHWINRKQNWSRSNTTKPMIL